MWSSTVSSAATIPIDDGWARPVDPCELEKCCLDRKFFEPNKKFHTDWIYKIFRQPLLECEPQPIPVPDSILFKRFYDSKSDIITKWAEKNLSPDNRTLNDVRLQHLKDIERINNSIKKYNLRKNPWDTENYISLGTHTSFLDKFFCFPLPVIKLGWKAVNFQQIITYAMQGFRIFIIDVRYGTEENHQKLVKHIRHARKVISTRVPSECIFTTVFVINDGRIRTGLMKHDTSVFLELHSQIILTSERKFSQCCSHKVIYINFTDYLENIKIDDIIEIGDRIKLQVKKIFKFSLCCKVVFEGLLKSKSIVKLPKKMTFKNYPDVSTETLSDVNLSLILGCDIIACHLNSKLLKFMHWVQAARHRSVILMAKIWLYEVNCKNYVDYLLSIARCFYIKGDGSNEDIPMRNYLVRQSFKNIIVIYRDGFLEFPPKRMKIPEDEESLKHFFLYPECIVLDPKKYDVSKYFEFIKHIYPESNKQNMILSTSRYCRRGHNLENIFFENIIITQLYSRSTCIIIINNNGEGAFMIAENRPIVPIIASFTSMATARAMQGLRNVHIVMYWNSIATKWENELVIRLSQCLEYGKVIGCITRTDRFLFVFDSQNGLRLPDTFRVLTLSDI